MWTVEKSDESVTVAGIRRGTQNEVRETGSSPRAQRAYYTNNKKYQTDLQAMLTPAPPLTCAVRSPPTSSPASVTASRR